MKMKINKISPYNKTLSVLAICFCLILAFVLLYPTTQVYADFSDINENTLVNFNQIANWYSLSNQYYNFSAVDGNGYSTITLTNQSVWWARLKLTNTTFIESHKYYVKQDNDKSYNIIIFKNTTSSNPTDYMLIQSGSSVIITGNNDFGFGYQSATANYFPLKQRIIVIDLTLMFGSGNEPNLIQANEYFLSNYYSYTTGTQMPFGKDYLQGYKDGSNDVWNSLTTTYNNDILGTITTPSTIEGFESNVDYNTQLGYYLVEGLAMLDFGANITSQVNYKGTYWIPNYTGGIYIVFFKYEGSVLSPLIISEIAYNNTSNFVDITFNINNQAQLYFGFFTNSNIYNNDTSTTMYCYTSELQLNTIDVVLLTQSAYARGVYETQKEYSEGGTKYETIYNLGKAEGIAEQNGYATGLDVIATTFTQVFSIFNIEILPGIPLTIFILLPLLFGLIMFIVKLTKGD